MLPNLFNQASPLYAEALKKSDYAVNTKYNKPFLKYQITMNTEAKPKVKETLFGSILPKTNTN